MAATNNSSEEVVDEEARAEIERLRRRFEGAHLVPPFWTIAKQMFQSIVSWAGWELFGLGGFVLLGFAVFLGICIFAVRGCDESSSLASQRTYLNYRENYGPTCEAMGLVFTSYSDNIVVCSGSDRIVTVDTMDIDETEVRIISE